MGLHGHIRKGGDGRIYNGITVTPTELQQIIEPPTGFNGIKEVTVNPIPSQYKKLETVTNAAAGDLIENKTAYTSDGVLVTGTIPVITGSDLNKEITTKTDSAIFPIGCYNVSPSARIASEEVSKIRANNIKYGISILGENGAFTEVEDGETGAVAAEVVAGRVCWVNGEKVEGTMANTGAVTGSISNVSDSIVVPQGYTSGGAVAIAESEQAKIVTGNIKAGVSILGVNGKASIVDTADGNVAAGDVLAGKVAYANGVQVTGTIVNNGVVGGVIETKTGYVTIPAGYTTGGTVSISAAEALKVQSGNIRKNVTLLGVTGDSNVVNTSTATATAADIAIGKTAYVQGQMITGTNPGGTGGHDYELITGEWYTYSGTYYNDEVTTIRFGMPYDAELPNVTMIYAYGFCYDKTCGTLKCQKLQYIEEYAFFSNVNIEELEAGALIEIGTAAFRNATSFKKLVITRTDGVATLSSSSAFTNTKIANGTGYIYVDDNLLTQYRQATNWSTYASQIKGISELV